MGNKQTDGTGTHLTNPPDLPPLALQMLFRILRKLLHPQTTRRIHKCSLFREP